MSVVAPEQLAAVGVVAAPEAAGGLAAVEAGVEGVKVAVRGAGAATAIVGAGEDVVEGGAEAGKGARVGSNTKAAAARRPAQLSAETSRITRLHTHMIRMSDTLRDLVILDFKKVGSTGEERTHASGAKAASQSKPTSASVGLNSMVSDTALGYLRYIASCT